MKTWLRNVLIVLCVLCLSAAFAGCDKEPDDFPLVDVPEFTGFSVGDLQNFLVIHPEYCSDELFQAGKAFCSAIEAKTGVRPVYRSSYVDGTSPEYTEGEYEILLGSCDNREEAMEASKSVRVADYGYRLIDKKIVLFGVSDETLMQAMDTFVNKVVNNCTSDMESAFYSSTMDYMYEADYEIDSVALNGIPLYEYGIVYPGKGELQEMKNAERLAAVLTKKTGYVLPVASDSSKKVNRSQWISVGSTKITDQSAYPALSDGAYSIRTDNGGNVLLAAGDISGVAGAVDALLEELTGAGARVEFSLDKEISGTNTLDQYTIMSFNILTTKPDEARINRVVNTILHADPDTVGLQEVSPYWMDILKKRLGDTYGYVGEGRDGGHNGEYSCIFYKKALFEVLDSGTYWLSETPDKVSSYETSAYRRIMTFAKLRCKSSGQEFVHINTHLDHESLEARIFQAGVLISYAQKHTGLPLLLTGDFNCVSSEETYKTVIGAGFSNAALEAAVTEKKPTFPGNGRIIDFIFCSSDVYPTEYEVIDEIIDGEYPSDHYPILVHYGM